VEASLLVSPNRDYISEYRVGQQSHPCGRQEEQRHLARPGLQNRYTNTHTDKYSMKDVSKCIVDIVRYGSMITIHLTTGFWKLLLHPRAWPYTTFIVPRQEKYQWVTTKIVLIGAPASFQ
jgi:hypothetical protein